MAYEKLLNVIDQLLTGPLFGALRAVDRQIPAYGSVAVKPDEANLAKIQVGHVLGSPEAHYLVEGLGTRLELYVQLNVYRLVVVYRLPSQGTLDREALQPRFARWALGANDAGWTIGWRDQIEVDETRWIEVYCYATLPVDFLADERHQLYWITDIVQMTRSFMIESQRAGVELDKTKQI